jgi:hypothetical protein
VLPAGLGSDKPHDREAVDACRYLRTSALSRPTEHLSPVIARHGGTEALEGRVRIQVLRTTPGTYPGQLQRQGLVTVRDPVPTGPARRPGRSLLVLISL